MDDSEGGAGVAIAHALESFFMDVYNTKYTKVQAREPLGQLLWDLGTKTSVCLIVRPTAECHGVLTDLAIAAESPAANWKEVFTKAKQKALMSYRGQPQLGRILSIYKRSNTELPESFWPFVRYICRNCMRAFPDLLKE